MFSACQARTILFLALLTLPCAARALPMRLVLAADGIAYRDLRALQKGITVTNFWGRKTEYRAFTEDEGYFPVSRMVSTFPSLSDIAWSDIFGDRPLPGYQRIYFSHAANKEIFTSGITTTMEYESQMDWQEKSGLLRSMGYLFPMHEYDREVRGMAEHFWQSAALQSNYYAYIRASDDAQHLDRNIMKMLCRLDRELQDLRARYREREGRDLQIVMLSDHGHNHAGRGRRLQLRSFLKRAGYRSADSIASPRDVILPDGGIEDWAEIHNSPGETEKLAQLLCHLDGVDILAAVLPDETNHFLVMNSRGERATVDWKPEKNLFRYSTETGDPLNYRPAVETLNQKHELDASGFASADAWMAATMTNRYPLALERIARGLTQNVLNPATILLSLDNRYVNDGWLTHQGSRLVTCRSTHGALDDLNSDGILLSNFQPTRDTSSDRAAAQFDNFPGVKDFRADEAGAELVSRREQSFVRISRVAFDREFNLLPGDGAYLRIWSPDFAEARNQSAVEMTIKKVSSFSIFENAGRAILAAPVSLPAEEPDERVYALPVDLKLLPQTEYKISCKLDEPKKTIRLFESIFHTDADGQPAAY